MLGNLAKQCGFLASLSIDFFTKKHTVTQLHMEVEHKDVPCQTLAKNAQQKGMSRNFDHVLNFLSYPLPGSSHGVLKRFVQKNVGHVTLATKKRKGSKSITTVT